MDVVQRWCSCYILSRDISWTISAFGIFCVIEVHVCCRFSSIVDIKAGIALNKTFVKLISW